MADRIALGRIGLIFSVATAAVILIGGVVVSENLNDRYPLDDGARLSAMAVTAVR